MLTTWVTPTHRRDDGRLSWTTIIILISAMIVPSHAAKDARGVVSSPRVDGAARGLARAPARPAGPIGREHLRLLLPNYICAVVAVIPAHVLQKVGRRLREAQELGAYHLVELLGRGGMGEVWRAEHRLLARGAASQTDPAGSARGRAAAPKAGSCSGGSSARRRRPPP
jgi:serine/threonine-protein kinase